MKRLYIKTSEGDFVIAGIENDIRIYVEDGIIYFGTESAVNLNNFISYNFEDE